MKTHTSCGAVHFSPYSIYSVYALMMTTVSVQCLWLIIISASQSGIIVVAIIAPICQLPGTLLSYHVESYIPVTFATSVSVTVRPCCGRKGLV